MVYSSPTNLSDRFRSCSACSVHEIRDEHFRSVEKELPEFQTGKDRPAWQSRLWSAQKGHHVSSPFMWTSCDINGLLTWLQCACVQTQFLFSVLFPPPPSSLGSCSQCFQNFWVNICSCLLLPLHNFTTFSDFMFT